MKEQIDYLIDADEVRNAPCKLCEGTGERHIANGDSDYDTDYCVCEIGEELREKNEHEEKN